MTRTRATILKFLLVCGLFAAATTFCGSGVIAQEAKAPDLAALRTQLDEAVRTGDRARALDLATQMIAATEPEHIEALYAAAQLHARMGHREQAYIYLNRAIRGGIRGSRPAARG